LATEMRAGRREPVAQVPPQLVLGLGRCRAHRTRALALWRQMERSRVAQIRGGLFFVIRSSRSWTPTPGPSPQGVHRGEGKQAAALHA
jgi:hypothetical protein